MNLRQLQAYAGRRCLAQTAEDRIERVQIVRPFLAPMGQIVAVCRPVDSDGRARRDTFILVRADRLDAVDAADPFGGEYPL